MMNGLRRKFAISLAAGMMALGLSACGIDSEASDRKQTILHEIDGFVGFYRYQSEEERLVTVFFDPYCVYCRQLWDSTENLRINQFWVPVAMLGGGESAPMSAVLLDDEAGDPSENFSKIKLAIERGSEIQLHPKDALIEAVIQNTERFVRADQRSVPVMAYRAINGDTVTKDIVRGAISRDEFVRRFVNSDRDETAIQDL